MVIADSHCHLFYKGIVENLKEKIEEANAAYVRYILTVSTAYDNIAKNIEIAHSYNNVFASVGIHPSSSEEKFNDISSFLTDSKVVAIGEVGLDYHDNISDFSKNSQIELFEKMLELNSYRDLPYIIHARDCFPDILDIMRNNSNGFRGVFHCYTGTIDYARQILDMGFYISFSGIITFKNAMDIREVLKYIPIEKILIETDAPYLAPYPYRGKLNEPLYVKLVAEKVAEVKNMAFENVAEITTNNFLELFKIKEF